MDNLKLFEWLMYGSAAVDAVSTFLRSGMDRWDIGISIVIILAVVVLTWLAANRGQFWPVVVLIIFTIFYAVLTLDHFVKFVPADITPVEPTRVKIVDTIGALLAIASLTFYFLGRRQRTV